MKPIYLDYNASTPLAAQVKEAMLPFLENHFGNPSSVHGYGVQMKQAVEEARSRVAALLNCDADEIYFTSGGTESNNLAIKGCAFAQGRKSGHIITSRIEHPAVLQVCAFLEQRDFSVTYLAVDRFGLISAESLEKAIRPDTFVITIMHANNEIGTIQPLSEISRIAKKFNILFHTDAAQSVGKIPVYIDDLGTDMLSLAGHKFYAPKGIGALYVRRGVHIEKQMHGAPHERNLRAGTENVLGIVGLGKACEIAALDLKKREAWLKARADQLLNGLTEALSGIQINGHPTQRLPNTVSISFYGLDANTILSELEGIAASAGAACHADSVEASHVLTAMSVPREWATGTIRFSVGIQTTKEEINTAVEKIIRTISKLRSEI
jgi:cysteine desulfurase